MHGKAGPKIRCDSNSSRPLAGGRRGCSSVDVVDGVRAASAARAAPPGKGLIAFFSDYSGIRVSRA